MLVPFSVLYAINVVAQDVREPGPCSKLPRSGFNHRSKCAVLEYAWRELGQITIVSKQAGGVVVSGTTCVSFQYTRAI